MSKNQTPIKSKLFKLKKWLTISEAARHLSIVFDEEVSDADDLVIITGRGQLIRQHVKSLRVMGRNTQGVRLINLNNEDTIADIARVAMEEDLAIEEDLAMKNGSDELST